MSVNGNQRLLSSTSPAARAASSPWWTRCRPTWSCWRQSRSSSSARRSVNEGEDYLVAFVEGSMHARKRRGAPEADPRAGGGGGGAGRLRPPGRRQCAEVPARRWTRCASTSTATRPIGTRPTPPARSNAVIKVDVCHPRLPDRPGRVRGGGESAAAGQKTPDPRLPGVRRVQAQREYVCMYTIGKVCLGPVARGGLQGDLPHLRRSRARPAAATSRTPTTAPCATFWRRTG